MRSIRNLRDYPAGLPLVPDELVEFHAARLLLLLKVCGGTKGKAKGGIDGLTKLAKLDFFVRYPAFFARACAERGAPVPTVLPAVESNMVRHHYGPWDHRYYHVLAYLEGKGLVRVTRDGTKPFRFQLTEKGAGAAEQLGAQGPFQELMEQMKRVRTVLGGESGTALKELIYRLFDQEVAARKLGEVIEE
ncbi:hypothetical protein [Hyalangium rubrum]|jgi:hypothetical protein|uniref:MarR family transcriptional regulator n=1 Tax=Hyalangium rubrum TaxID=3103134 RepID=A0ABU5HAS8_9BACT|nr:hypothetical protein [Hyalangium sp. s54d21]MDY7229902.1 hypothetical protein [Hyalangium sp. s54d21]